MTTPKTSFNIQQLNLALDINQHDSIIEKSIEAADCDTDASPATDIVQRVFGGLSTVEDRGQDLAIPGLAGAGEDHKVAIAGPSLAVEINRIIDISNAINNKDIMTEVTTRARARKLKRQR